MLTSQGATGKETGLAPFQRAATAVKDAEFDLAADKPARVSALKTYVDRLQLLTDKASMQYKAGSIDFNQLQELRISLIDAKIRLKNDESK